MPNFRGLKLDKAKDGQDTGVCFSGQHWREKVRKGLNRERLQMKVEESILLGKKH